MGGVKNHNTVFYTMSDGKTYRAHAYETKTLIVMEWYEDVQEEKTQEA